MKLFSPKTYSVVDIGCLKWCCILIGMIIGASRPKQVMKHAGILGAVAVVLAIKPAVSFFNQVGCCTIEDEEEIEA
jgi:putative Mn2+ efflux pump MntP